MNTLLPKVSKEEMGEIALKVHMMEWGLGGNWFKNPNNSRREIVSTAKLIGVDPNKFLSMIWVILEPKLEEMFRPITSEQISQFEKEREEQKKQRELQKQHGQVRVIRDES